MGFFNSILKKDNRITIYRGHDVPEIMEKFNNREFLEVDRLCKEIEEGSDGLGKKYVVDKKRGIAPSLAGLVAEFSDADDYYKSQLVLWVRRQALEDKSYNFLKDEKHWDENGRFVYNSILDNVDEMARHGEEILLRDEDHRKEREERKLKEQLEEQTRQTELARKKAEEDERKRKWEEQLRRDNYNWAAREYELASADYSRTGNLGAKSRMDKAYAEMQKYK